MTDKRQAVPGDLMYRQMAKNARMHLENFTQIRDIRREACHPFRKKGWRAPEEYHPNKPIETRGLFR